MTWVDLVVLAVLAVSALLAFMRGLVREVLGLAAWVGAIAAAVWALPRVRPQFQEWFGTSPWIDPAALGVVFLITLIVLMLISRWIGALVRASPIGGLDRTLGLVFGLARGVAVVVLAYIVGGWVERPAQWPAPVREARSLGVAYMGALGCRSASRTTGDPTCTSPRLAARPRLMHCCTPPRRAGRSASRRFGIRRAKA